MLKWDLFDDSQVFPQTMMLVLLRYDIQEFETAFRSARKLPPILQGTMMEPCPAS